MYKTPPPIDWLSELTEGLKNGLTVRQLSAKLGVHPPAVHKHEHRTGIRLQRIRKIGRQKGANSGVDWPTVLREAKEAGTSATALARALSVSLTAVLGAEDRTGIFLKRRHHNKNRNGGFGVPDENRD